MELGPVVRLAPGVSVLAKTCFFFGPNHRWWCPWRRVVVFVLRVLLGEPIFGLPRSDDGDAGR